MNKNKNAIFSIVALSITLMILQQTAFAAEINFLDLPIGLKIGETGYIDENLEMTLLDVEDSRCPSDVVCVWQGMVTAKIQLQKGTQDLGVHSISTETMEGSEETYDGYYIRLTNIEPYPESTSPIEPSDYVLTFFVSMAEPKIDSPLKQFRDGIPFSEIVCHDGLQKTQRYDGRPACVKSNTYDELIKRDWVSDIIRAVQSRDLSDGKDQVEILPVIKTGTNAGFCLGYCSKDFVITPEKITYTIGGREVPEKTKEVKFSKTAWNELKGLVDFKKFNSLPNQIGCPGCADAPVLYIEISTGDKTKRVEFENGDDIPEINKLISALQKIRDPIESNIESFEECIAAGNPAMESYPRQCRTSDGKHFVEEVDPMFENEVQCVTNGGQWLSEFNECENISENLCTEMNGTFKECESACRHDPDAEMCTMQCVQVCEFS